MSEEDELPDPGKELTRPERWIAERLTPYRVFWIKRATNFLLIAAFIYASAAVFGFQQDLHSYHAALEAEGCIGVPESHTPSSFPE